MSDTPRTDAAAAECHGMPPHLVPEPSYVPAEFARELERELNRFSCFRCGDHSTPLYCRNCADELRDLEQNA